jgi:starch phosphorylase
MPEALEKWPVELLGNLLPRHLEIIYEINNRFLNEVKKKYPGDEEKIKRMSIIEETPVKSIRMANLAIVGSHSVNGVAKLHTKILKEELFKDFDQFFPDKFNNKTNGITPRRWLKLCNPDLSKLITDTIGDKWVTDLFELKKLNKYADNKDFQKKWKNAKLQNKIKLAEYIENKYKIKINLNSIFDCQIKRFHEYKRQLLNILHVIHFYNFIKDNPKTDIVPRTVIFAGKAAPGYFIAKMIIKLINSVADVVNNDPEINDKLKVIFLENYNVSLGELVFPAADLSEQISTAGTEASGTGCMKFALNGALTIGTLDGANIEMMDEIGKDNIFIFGLTKSQIDEEKKNKYNPWNEYNSNPEIKEIIDQIKGGTFSKGDTSLFEPIVRTLLDWGDNYMVLKDFSFYIDAQKKVSEAFRDQDNWTRMSIINSASMGQFSSDRCIYEYATKIWNVKPVCVDDRKKTTVPKPRTKKTK